MFLIIYVDDFKLAGPKHKLKIGWDLLKGASEGVPNGIQMDPPEPVGRYLGCKHVVYEKEIDWQGEEPTILDPPPPKIEEGVDKQRK